MRTAIDVYRQFLKLYPAGFREEYGMPMERQFRDDYRDAPSGWQRVLVFASAIADLLTCAPRQILHELAADVRHASRLSSRNWVSTALAVIALSLAIGLSTGVFTVLNALLLRGLPFSNPDQLTEMWFPSVNAFQGRAAFKRWSRSSIYLEDAASFSTSEMNLNGGRQGLRVKAAETSANFFSVLGVTAAMGRTFLPNEDAPGHNAVAVISDGLWQQMFAGNPDASGMALRVNGQNVTVIGVAPAGFDYPSKTSIWLPSGFDFEIIPRRGAFFFHTIGRLRKEFNVAKAKPLFEAEARRGNPKQFQEPDEMNRPRLISLRNELAGPVRKASWVLAGLTLLVLLTACANVAQLLLSRAFDRRPELELRAALGAGRIRLLQQLVTEACLITLSGAVIGLGVAQWTAQIAWSFAPAQLVVQQYTILDWRVLSFAMTLAVIIGIMFGALPVLLLGRKARPGSLDRSANKLRTTLIILQTAFVLCLVSGSLAMGRAFLHLMRVDLGFRPASVVTLNVSPQGTRSTGADEWAYYSEALDRLRAVPGVVSAGAVSYLPLADNLYMANSFKLDSGQQVNRVITNAATSGYFRAMGTHLLAGSDFGENTGSSVVVNQAFAQSTGLGNRVLNRMLIAPWNGERFRISGVVDTTRLGGPTDAGGPQAYWRLRDEPPAALTLVASVHGQPEEFLARCREAVRRVDSAVPVYDVTTLDQRLAERLAQPRFYTTAAIFLGLLAVLLAAIGTYGTAVYSIGQRTRELGIRIALGASHGRIWAEVFSRGLLPILLGSAAGLLFSAFFTRFLEHLLPSASQSALTASIESAALLLLTGTIAIGSANYRILKIEPASALRHP